MVIAVAGDIEKARALEGLRKLLEGLPKNRGPERNLSDPAGTPPVLAFIQKSGQVQSQARLSLPGIKRTHPAYWKLGLLMDIFGGNDSLLYTRLRDELGLVYAAYFYQTYRWQAGMLVGYIGCKGDKTGQAIQETVKIMGSLGKDIPIREVEQKRLDALNSFVFNVDTPMELAEVYGRYHMRKEPLDTLERIQDAYISVTRDELVGLAKQFLDPKKLQVFVVGDKTTEVVKEDGATVTLEEDLKTLAEALGLPYKEIELR